MTTWVRRAVLQARLPGEKIPKLQDLQETKTMLSDRIIAWADRVRDEGELDGQRKALTVQIQEKFGSIQQSHVDLVANASDDQILQWFKKVLTATTPGELFGT